MNGLVEWWYKINLKLEVHDYVHLFPTPFIDEVLKNVVFLGYHQMKIVEEHRKNTRFSIEWGLFAYNVIPFGMKKFPCNLLFNCSYNFRRVFA